jgi:hypothetical protein
VDTIPIGRKNFHGREAVLHRIDEGLRDDAVVAITGMSGIGKTSIAIRYAQVHHDLWAENYVTVSDQRLRLRWPPGHGPRPERFADRVGRSRALPGAAPGAVAVPTPGDIELVAMVLADGAASGDGPFVELVGDRRAGR